MTKTINILGDTQREQWHSIVNMLKPFISSTAAYPILDEIHRYIDFAEDKFDEIRKEQENGSNDSSER